MILKRSLRGLMIKLLGYNVQPMNRQINLLLIIEGSEYLVISNRSCSIRVSNKVINDEGGARTWTYSYIILLRVCSKVFRKSIRYWIRSSFDNQMIKSIQCDCWSNSKEVKPCFFKLMAMMRCL